MSAVDWRAVSCPICSAGPGEPCQDATRGWLTTQTVPHWYRMQVAVEETV
ncbi:hypothetical protein [Mycolicibacterium fortuitum]|jgi:hypothetical protein|nr:hypothetical protein [Mycolicibacterium fortuitum]